MLGKEIRFHPKVRDTDQAERQRGFIGLLALVISAGIIGYMMYAYFDKSPQTGKSAAENNRAAIDTAKDIQIQAEIKAKATNEVMGL